MHGVMARPLPDLPWISAFIELNLRLYVECDGRPGVWFLSLDAANRLAVWAARRFFHLPYFRAEMRLSTGPGEEVDFECRRRGAHPGVCEVEFEARYRPTSEVYAAAPGSLEHWLTERYCFYARAPDGKLFRVDAHHAPWPLQRAEAEIEPGELLAPHGIAVSGPPALLHFSRRIDVIGWFPVELETPQLTSG